MGTPDVISFLNFVVFRWLVFTIGIDGICISIAIGLIVQVDVSFFNPSREPCNDLAHGEINLRFYFKRSSAATLGEVLAGWR